MSTGTPLPVAYADTRADELTFSLAEPELPPLVRRDWDLDGLRLSLRLLGASHQVVLDVDGGDQWCETVACLHTSEPHLPGAFRDHGYEFRAGVDTMSSSEFSRTVAAVSDRARHHIDGGGAGLIGSFPGRPLAVTAVVALERPGLLSWQTWHTYPQTGEVVTTMSSYRWAQEPVHA